MNQTKLTQIIREYRVPEHIVAHMNKVAQVAVFIGRKLKINGHKVNLTKVRQAAQLHDFVKFVDFKTINLSYFKTPPPKKDLVFWQKLIRKYYKDKHCIAAFKILIQKGERELALIIKKHAYESLIDSNPAERPSTWEEKLLYYADKRVKFDKIVTIQQRIKDGHKRYFADGKIPANDFLVQKALKNLEKEICQNAGIKPGDLNGNQN